MLVQASPFLGSEVDFFVWIMYTAAPSRFLLAVEVGEGSWTFLPTL